MNKKSILEQALLQVEALEEAVKANAKGILSSTVKNELNSVLEQMDKTTEKDEEDDVIPDEVENDVADETADEENVDANLEAGDEDLETGDEDLEAGDEDLETGDEDLETGDEDLEAGDEDLEADDEEPVLDMTGASDGEVLRVFKALKDDDGVVIKKEGNTIELQDGDNDYVIKLDNLNEGYEDENFSDEDFSDEEDIYEIVLDDEDEMEEEFGDEPMEAEFTEAARTKWNPHGNKTPNVKRAGLPSKKIFKAGSGQINEEVEKLKKQNSEYKKALGLFKEKLNEIAVFNANLAFATRLFTEHTTTKNEKLDILKRFDNISTITESKKLYSTISGELSNKKPMTETVVEKITTSPKTSSTEILAESKAYENPQFARMKDLMKKIK